MMYAPHRNTTVVAETTTMHRCIDALMQIPCYVDRSVKNDLLLQSCLLTAAALNSRISQGRMSHHGMPQPFLRITSMTMRKGVTFNVSLAAAVEDVVGATQPAAIF